MTHIVMFSQSFFGMYSKVYIQSKQTNNEIGRVLIIMERWGSEPIFELLLCFVFFNPHHNPVKKLSHLAKE